jgi:hypothetical protein
MLPLGEPQEQRAGQRSSNHAGFAAHHLANKTWRFIFDNTCASAVVKIKTLSHLTSSKQVGSTRRYCQKCQQGILIALITFFHF